MTDLKHLLAHDPEYRTASYVSTLLAMLLLAAACVWAVVYAKHQESTPQTISREDAVRMSTQELAESTVWINKEMEKRARGEK